MAVTVGTYEYGILHERIPDEPHREGMTQADARQWLAEWAEMNGGNEAPFSVIRRPVGEWEAA